MSIVHVTLQTRPVLDCAVTMRAVELRAAYVSLHVPGRLAPLGPALATLCALPGGLAQGVHRPPHFGGDQRVQVFICWGRGVDLILILFC